MKAPTAFVCSRQGLRVLKDEKVFGNVSNGGYLLKQRENANITIMASGELMLLSNCLFFRKKEFCKYCFCSLFWFIIRTR